MRMFWSIFTVFHIYFINFLVFMFHCSNSHPQDNSESFLLVEKEGNTSQRSLHINTSTGKHKSNYQKKFKSVLLISAPSLLQTDTGNRPSFIKAKLNSIK